MSGGTESRLAVGLTGVSLALLCLSGDQDGINTVLFALLAIGGLIAAGYFFKRAIDRHGSFLEAWRQGYIGGGRSTKRWLDDPVRRTGRSVRRRKLRGVSRRRRTKRRPQRSR